MSQLRDLQVLIVSFGLLCSSLYLKPTCGFRMLPAAVRKVLKQFKSSSADVQLEAAGALLLIVFWEWDLSEEAERCCDDSQPRVWPSERRRACRANTWSQRRFMRNVETLHPGPMHWEFNGNYSWRLFVFIFGGLSNQFGRSPFVVFSF